MPDYFAVLAALHRMEKPRNYLEIGVRCGDSLRLARPDTFCVGVDPDPHLAPDVQQRCQLETTTSDVFFLGGRAQELFGEQGIDLAFIDGMHLFEYVLRDFINVERHSHQNSMVVVHDVLPPDPVTASRDRSTEDWTGDVWKFLLVLTDRRPDLQVCLLDAPPSGLGLIRGLDASNNVLSSSYDAILDEYLGLSFADWERRERELVRGLLGSRVSVRWRRRLLRQVSLSLWQTRVRHPLLSLLAVPWIRRIALPLLQRRVATRTHA